MAEKLKVGVCSLVHDHVWGELNHWLAHPDVEVVAVGEANERLRAKALAKGVPKAYESWQALLESERLDIVQATSDNATSPEIVEAAMAAGAHVVTEKPMAATLEQANRMAAAATKYGKRLMVNWPHPWEAAYQEWERRVLGGEIGRVVHIKRRNAHNGPREIGCDPAFVEWLYDEARNGAGAYMDFCGYGVVIAARVLGTPKRVTAIRGVLAKEYAVPDDVGTILMEFDRAVAQAEASWCETASAPGPHTVAYGTEGSCSIADGKVYLHRTGKEMEEIDPPAKLTPKRNGPEYFTHCIVTGEPIEGCCSPEVSLLAQKILQAGLLAAETGTAQTLS